MTISTLRELALAAVDPDGVEWQTRLPELLADPGQTDASLVALCHAFELAPAEIVAVALAAAVEDDVHLGRRLAQLQTPVGASRPLVGMLAAALAPAVRPPAHALYQLSNGNAVRCGALVLLEEGAPLAERPLSVPLPVCLALADLDSPWPGATLGPESYGGVPLPASVLESASKHAAGLREAERALVVRSGSQAEARSVAVTLATALGRRPVFFDADLPTGIAPWLWLRQLVPVVCLDLAPGERKRLSRPPQYFGPLIVLCGPDGSVELTGWSTPLNWRLPVPSEQERAVLWSQAIGVPALADRLAHEHRLTSGRIADLGRLAVQVAASVGRETPGVADVVFAARSGEGTGLEALAQPMLEPIPEDALVMTDGLRDELEALLQRCRARDGLVRNLGPSAVARYVPGIRALFAGPSGTGKTLAAGWLATRLGLPLFRVDLAAVTSKYIGETEKNLSQLLARAEHDGVVLLFDEADSLFGKRTEVREANDRFANAQTNYLLQRIESFDGITLLTSNGRARFDSAFSRRLDAIIEFPLPGPEERRALWRAHLGAANDITTPELNRLAAVADLAGGHIRNVVLSAAVHAAQTGSRIAYRDAVFGVLGEYRKLGRQVPAELLLDTLTDGGLKTTTEPDGNRLRPAARAATPATAERAG